MFGHVPDPKRIKLMKTEVFKDKIKPDPKTRMIRKVISEIARSGWMEQPDPEEPCGSMSLRRAKPWEAADGAGQEQGWEGADTWGAQAPITAAKAEAGTARPKLQTQQQSWKFTRRRARTCKGRVLQKLKLSSISHGP